MGKHGKRASAFKASLAAAGYDVLETPREHGGDGGHHETALR